MKNEIYEAFDQFVDIDGDESITNWLDQVQDKLPLTTINKLKNGESMAIELKREQLDEVYGSWNNSPSMPKVPENTQFAFANHKVSRLHNQPLQPGEKTIQLIIKKEVDPKFPENKNFKISAVEFQIPRKNTLLPAGIVFEKELTGKEFENAIQNLNLE